MINRADTKIIVALTTLLSTSQETKKVPELIILVLNLK